MKQPFKQFKLLLATLALTITASALTIVAMSSINTNVALAQSAPQTAAVEASAPEQIALAQSPAPQAQAMAYDNVNSPVELVASYYNAIGRQEYRRAYRYWRNPPQSYNAFANGFSDTTSVQLIVQPPTQIGAAAGSLYASVPTVLVAKHTDGSTHTYAGCITTRKSNLQPPDDPQAGGWSLYGASLSEVPNNTNIASQLARACSQ